MIYINKYTRYINITNRRNKLILNIALCQHNLSHTKTVIPNKINIFKRKIELQIIKQNLTKCIINALWMLSLKAVIKINYCIK